MPKAYEPELGQMCFGNAWAERKEKTDAGKTG